MGGHQQAVHGATLMRSTAGDGALLAASGSKDGELRLWDVANGTCTAQFHLENSGGITGVAAAAASDENAQLFVSTRSGHVHALTADADAAALRVVASGGPASAASF